MKADVTRRLAAAPEAHYVGVVHQQGRVWLDSDWNQDLLERLALLESETFDIVGACGVPQPGTAFAISAIAADPTNFQITGGPGALGRYYVDGLLAQLDQTATYTTQPDLPDPPKLVLPLSDKGEARGLVYLEVWRRLVTYLEDSSLRDVALGGPDSATRLKTLAQVKVVLPPNSTDLTCATSGRFLPGRGSGTLTTLQPTNQQPDDLCSLPDPANYTGLENHLYRVEIHNGGDVLQNGGGNAGFAFNEKLGQDVPQGALTITLATPLTAPQAAALERAEVVLLSDSTGQSETLSVSSIDSTNLTLTLTGPVLGNYTVANSAGVSGGVARFKWSRDNASFAVTVSDVPVDRQTLTLTSLGRDVATTLRQGDLVEIEDDASDLGPARGHLTILTDDPDPDLLTTRLAVALPANFETGRHLRLRRWDGVGWARATFDPTSTSDMDLGDGVHVHFGGTDLRAGDFWQFATRTADGSVEALADAPPTGIIRHVCPLAVIHWQARTTFRFSALKDVYANIGLDASQLDQLAQRFDTTGDDAVIDAATAISAAQQLNPAATPAQITNLEAQFADLAAKGGPGVEQGPVIVDIEDCRRPFDPLTDQHDAQCDCECSITVAPGESLSAAIAHVGPGGGVVCLLPGVHDVIDTVIVSNRSALTLRGAGAATVVRSSSPVVLRFESCDHLTLRDFAVVSGERGEVPNSNALDTVADLEGLTTKELPNSVLDGVITFEGCTTVEADHCTVRCLSRPLGQPTRPCVAFRGAPAGANNQAASPDLTLSHCRLHVDGRQSGVLVTRATDILVQNCWVVNLTTLHRLGFADVDPPSAGSPLGLFGFAFINCSRLLVADNVLLGVEVAIVAEAQSLTLRGDVVDACNFGIFASASNGLLLSECSVATQRGPAIVVDAQGVVVLRGNVARAPALVPAAAPAPALQASVVRVQANSATLSGNRMRALGELPPSHAVDVRAGGILYEGNTSTCEALPVRTNVLLFASVDGTSGGWVNAVSNTCLEPSIAPLASALSQVAAAQKDQITIMQKFFDSGDVNIVATELTQTMPPTWTKLSTALASAEQQVRRNSLIAVGPNAVTGLNLLSYRLVRVGMGADQGSVSGVFGQ